MKAGGRVGACDVSANIQSPRNVRKTNVLKRKRSTRTGAGQYKLTVEILETRRFLAGDLSLEDPVGYYVGDSPLDLAAGDLNGDGDVDLAVANFGGAPPAGDVSVLLGHGDGTFADEVRYQAGNKPASIAVGDVSGDGHLDIVVGSGGLVSVLLNQGDGTYPLNPPSYLVAEGKHTSDVTVVDLDGNGTLDIVTSIWQGTVYVLQGHGDGTFESAIRIGGIGVGEGTGNVISSLAVGDLDADNDLDVAFVNPEDDNVFILLQTASGTFSDGNIIQLPANADPRSIVIGDIDNDGNSDLVTANYGLSSVSVIFGRGDGTFEESTELDVGHRRPFDVTVVDLDVDGDTDMAVLHFTAELSIVLNEGHREFGLPLSTDLPNAASSWSVIDADVDLDGVSDLIATNNGCCRHLPGVAVVMNTTEPLVGDANLDGNVSFEDFVKLSTNFGLANAHWWDGDFDSNGTVDFSDFVLLTINFGQTRQSASTSELDDFAYQSLEFASTGSESTRHKTDVKITVALDILVERWVQAEM